MKTNMNIKLKHAINNLRINPGRTLLVLFALVIGLWGLGSLSVSYTILRNDLTENFIRTKPAHVTITSKDFSSFDIDQFRDRPDVESAEFRDITTELIEVYPNRWFPLILFGVEDFTNFHLGEFFLEKGQKVPPAGTILIEREGLKLSTLDVGSSVRIRGRNSEIINVPISGICYDPALAPGTMEHMIYGYTDKKTYSMISGKESNRQLIFRLNNISSRQDIQRLTSLIAENLRSDEITIEKISIPVPDEHPHQFQLDSLMYLQACIGLLAFVMGVILVWQLMNAIMARHVRQIGILKAVGASRNQVLFTYSIMVFILGLVSCVIAIPLAIKTGFGYAAFVAGVLNFEILTQSLPFQLYFFLISAGILFPFIASFSTLSKGVDLSVVEALADYGAKLERSNSSVTKLPLSSKMSMAVRNTMRQKTRLIITIAALALGIAIFNSGFNLRQSLITALDEIRSSLNYDVQVILKDQLSFDQVAKHFDSIDNVDQMEAWSGGTCVVHTGKYNYANEISVIAPPYNTELINMQLFEGRWFENSEEPEIVVNPRAFEIFEDPEIGKSYEVYLQGQKVRLKLTGIIDSFGPPIIYMDREVFDRACNHEHNIKRIVFSAEDKELRKIALLQRDIETAIESSDLSVLSLASNVGLLASIYAHLNIILTMVTVLALLVLIVSALGMASAMGVNILERTREIGVLRAIGAVPKLIRGMFVIEGMVVICISIMIGLVVAWPLSTLMAWFFGGLIFRIPMDYAFSISGFLITVSVTLGFGWLASRIPAAKAGKISTREALAYE